MHLKIYKYIFLVIIILASACYQEQEKSGSSREDKASIPVKAEILKEQEYKVIIEGIGKIDSKHRATLIFESQGQLEKIYKKLGDKITRGDVIAEINSSVYQSTYKLAEAAYEKAQSDLQDARTLLDKNAISNEEFNLLSLAEISSKSNYIQASERYKKCSLTAPFDGTIVGMNLNLGEYIPPGQTLLPPIVLADMDHLIIDVSVSEEEITQIQIGQDVLIHVKSYTNKPFYGKVTEVGLMSNQGTNSFKIQVSLTNTDHELKLGMIANVWITVNQIDKALVISRKYILENSEGKYVYTISNAQAQMKHIKIKDLKGDLALVNGDIIAGDSLITQGYRKISIGTKVKVIN
jgi:membrane fusion protein (multidrug efflux system)